MFRLAGEIRKTNKYAQLKKRIHTIIENIENPKEEEMIPRYMRTKN